MFSFTLQKDFNFHRLLKIKGRNNDSYPDRVFRECTSLCEVSKWIYYQGSTALWQFLAETRAAAHGGCLTTSAGAWERKKERKE